MGIQKNRLHFWETKTIKYRQPGNEKIADDGGKKEIWDIIGGNKLVDVQGQIIDLDGCPSLTP